jgi:omega-6 fatty acid desaturase (delta-12 desaturase)
LLSDHDTAAASSTEAPGRDLRRRLSGFQAPILHRSLGQILTSIGGYIAVCTVMYAVAGVSYWLTLCLAPLAAALLVRAFIIQHDCGHGAFFRSRRLNDALGAACSLLTLAPYLSWRRQHAGHHGVWNNLDRRNSGADIYSTCLTADEYRSFGPWRRRWYRLSRSPVVANLVLPPLVFLVLYRFPFDMPAGWRRERIAIQLTNLALVALFGGLGLVFGFGQVAAIHLPVMVLASIVGVWLFSVQHRSEEAAWARHDEWNAVTASLQGSTYLRLPRILQWFTGNIGLHHVHHLNPRIPNYRLQQCHEAVAELRRVPVVTLRSAFRSMLYVLWDERGQRMVTFRAAELA